MVASQIPYVDDWVDGSTSMECHRVGTDLLRKKMSSVLGDKDEIL